MSVARAGSIARKATSQARDFSPSTTLPADLPYPVALAVKKLRRKEILGAPNDAGERQVIGHTIEVEMHDKIAPLPTEVLPVSRHRLRQLAPRKAPVA